MMGRMGTARTEELFGQMHEEVSSLRLAVALWRDGMLNESELTAMLEVYEEFGR